MCKPLTGFCGSWKVSRRNLKTSIILTVVLDIISSSHSKNRAWVCLIIVQYWWEDESWFWEEYMGLGTQTCMLWLIISFTGTIPVHEALKSISKNKSAFQKEIAQQVLGWTYLKRYYRKYSLWFVLPYVVSLKSSAGRNLWAWMWNIYIVLV